MTREEIFAAYYPICDTVARVLQAASRSISEADFRRAARWLGGEGNTFPAADEADITFATDLALFEPNQRRRRAFERESIKNHGAFKLRPPLAKPDHRWRPWPGTTS